MDLQGYKHSKVWILHLAGAAAKYSVACLVKMKRKDEIIKHIDRTWTAYFGSPR